MSNTPYIGNFTPLQMFPENTRDDIVPAPPQTTFNLSQEVPGGYEGNIMVFKRQYRTDQIVAGSSTISFNFSSNAMTTSNASVATALSLCVPGELLLVANTASNNGTYKILTIAYDGASASVVFDPAVKSVVANETNVAANITRLFDGPWEVLQPETDYTIGGTSPYYNRQITFSLVPQQEDQIYIIHRGSATFNNAPSPNSVTAESLAYNLRDFLVERFTGNGSTTAFTLTRDPVTSRGVIVSVNGVQQDDDDTGLFPNSRDYFVSGTTLTFRVAPANATKIRVQHLSFSSVSRRLSLSAGQLATVPDNSVTSAKIANDAVISSKIADGNVVTSKIADDNVTGAKILLANNQSLRGSSTPSGSQNLIRNNLSNHTVISNTSTIKTEINGTNTVVFTATTVEPETTNTVDFGLTGKRFKNGFLSGNLDVAGNIVCPGTVDGIDVSVLGGRVTTLENNVTSYAPVGAIIMDSGASAPDANWLQCLGQAVSRSTYAALFARIGTTYGPGDGSTTFNLPNLQQVFPLGRTTTVAQPATTLGTVVSGSPVHTHGYAHTHNASVSGTLPNHVHSVGTYAGTNAHTHDISHTHSLPGHTHAVPAHFHSGGNLTVDGNGYHSHSAGDYGHAHSYYARNDGITNSTNLANKTVSASAASEVAIGVTTGYANIYVNPDGYHGHTLSGAIGNVFGYNGNNNFDTVSMSAATVTGSGLTSGASSNSAVSVSGSSGNPTTTPGITSTGSTTSQSISTTDSTTIPYIVLNFIIRVLA